jgi:transposase
MNSTKTVSLLQLKIEDQQKEIETKNHEIASLQKQVDWFKEQFKLANQRHFGKSSETSSSMNLVLFDEGLSEQKSPEENANEEKQSISYERKKKSKGRHLDVSKFPKQQKIYDLEECDKVCACGETLESAGSDTSIQIDHIPETFQVIEHVSLKYCCRQCETIKSAKKPETAIPKCMATPGFVAEVISKKYEHHLPLYRQSKMFLQLGADIPDNTLGNWVMRAAESLKPLDDAQRLQIPMVNLLQADETKVKTLKPNKEGYLWGYHSGDPGNRFILFEFAGTRSASVPNQTLKDFKGKMQTDGYSGYNDFRKKSSVINFGCWDHCRRKFTDVVKVSDKNKNGKAAETLVLINKLYDIEREAKDFSVDDRRIYRHEKSRPILKLIHDLVTNINAPPKSLLGVAITYTKNQWPYLTEYINHGEVPISNCWIENQIRPFALGRKNWLFTGTSESANKAALLYGLIQTCKMNGIQPRAYLEYVLNHAHVMRRGEISPTSLLPQFIDKSIL